MMGFLSIKELVAVLLGWISLNTGMIAPQSVPQIVFVPHSQLEEIVCVGKCPVWGYYDPRQILYLDDSLDPSKDLCAQSILLHELVHFVQRETDRFAGYENKVAWLLREREARHVQRIFLRQHSYRHSLASHKVYFQSGGGSSQGHGGQAEKISTEKLPTEKISTEKISTEKLPTEKLSTEKLPVAAYAAPRC